MRFRRAIEIGVMCFGAHPFLPRMQVGQWVKVDGQLGRWVGVSRGGVVWILWPRTVPGGLRLMAEAYRRAMR